MWIDEAIREEALFRGYTVVDPATVMTTHLTEILKDNMAELLSYAETQKLLDELGKEQQKLVDDIVPSQISIAGMQRVLQTLLRERVSIRDLPAILEGIAEAVRPYRATSWRSPSMCARAWPASSATSDHPAQTATCRS